MAIEYDVIDKNTLFRQKDVRETTVAPTPGSGLTEGSVVFIDAEGFIAEDNANLFWDNSNNFLGVGTNTPAFMIDVFSASGTDAAARFVTAAGVDDAEIQLITNGQQTWFIEADRSEARLDIGNLGGDLLTISNGGIVDITSGTLDMNTHQINNVVDPTANQDAATKKYVDDEDAAADAHISATGASHSYINQNVTTTGTPTFGITTLGDSSQMASSAAPTADADIANKKYVDDQLSAAAVGGSTQYWSAPGSSFLPETQIVSYTRAESATGYMDNSTDNTSYEMAVHLPNGAIVTEVIVHGTNTNVWKLERCTFAQAVSTMATANVDTADSTITNATIDSSTYSYRLIVVDVDNGDEIDAARIVYTMPA